MCGWFYGLGQGFGSLFHASCPLSDVDDANAARWCQAQPRRCTFFTGLKLVMGDVGRRCDRLTGTVSVVASNIKVNRERTRKGQITPRRGRAGLLADTSSSPCRACSSGGARHARVWSGGCGGEAALRERLNAAAIFGVPAP
jgi:hypothetical protein